mgnify:CR=1 FL=1
MKKIKGESDDRFEIYVNVISDLGKTRFNLQICNISTLKNLVVFFIILNVINETGRRYDIDK